MYFYLLSTLRRVAQLYVTLALEILMRAFCYNHFRTECRRNKKIIKKVQCPFIIAPLVRLERMGNTFLDFVETVEAVAPGVRDSLNPGSSSKAISKVEKVVGFELPEQLVSIWSLHNGQKPSTPWNALWSSKRHIIAFSSHFNSLILTSSNQIASLSFV